MEEREQCIIVHFPDKLQTFYYLDSLASLPQLNDDPTSIVITNTKEHIKQMLEQWNSLISHPKLSIMFVNTTHFTKFALYPTTHERITEKETLELGLMTMGEECGFME